MGHGITFATFIPDEFRERGDVKLSPGAVEVNAEYGMEFMIECPV
jgi:hypothetical protein